MRTHPDATPSALAAVIGLFGDDAEEDDLDEARAAVLLDDAERAARQADRQQVAAARSGVATALESLSGVLSGSDVKAALDFLVNRGLAEPQDAVREAMVVAGEWGVPGGWGKRGLLAVCGGCAGGRDDGNGVAVLVSAELYKCSNGTLLTLSCWT